MPSSPASTSHIPVVSIWICYLYLSGGQPPAPGPALRRCPQTSRSRRPRRLCSERPRGRASLVNVAANCGLMPGHRLTGQRFLSVSALHSTRLTLPNVDAAAMPSGGLPKRVIVTPAVYSRLDEPRHFDIQSTGQKSHSVNITL